MAEGALGITEIENQEHISFNKTGDNISAKRVVPYYWDGTNWQRQGAELIPGSYDALTYTATSATVDTFKYFTGGVSGTLVATLTVTYTDSTHATLVSVART